MNIRVRSTFGERQQAVQDLSCLGVCCWHRTHELQGDRLFSKRRTWELGLLFLLASSSFVGCSSKNAGQTTPPVVPENGETASSTDSAPAAPASDIVDDTPDSKAKEDDAGTETQDGQLTDGSPANGAKDPDSLSSDDSAVPAHWSNASWTRKRLVALAATGPVVLDLEASVGGQSLAEASDAMAGDIWRELFESPESEDGDLQKEGGQSEPQSESKFESPSEPSIEEQTVDKESPSERASASTDEPRELKWDELLEHPVIKSGWLGNLVPDDEQEDQIFSMYDEGQDRKVTLSEFQNFLSRGLSRRAALQVSDTGAQAGADMGASPWGDIDLNQDYAVDQDEQTAVAKAVEKYDFNADSIVSLQELNQPESAGQTDGGMQYSSMLDVNTLYIADGLFDEDSDKRFNEQRQLAKKILNHYTFLEGIERAQWSSWSDERWNELDTNGDGLLKQSELEAMGRQEPVCRLSIYLPAAPGMVSSDSAGSENAMSAPGMNAATASAPSVQVMALTSAGEQVPQVTPGWVTASEGGRLTIGGVILQVIVDDAYSASNADLLRQRLEMALSNEQFENFARNQLQLEEDAFGLIDEDEDDKLSDAEFRRVWRWLTVRQSARALGRWMTVQHPWFQLLDLTGDQKLSQKELADAADTISRLDADADGSVAPNELPLLVRFEFNRTDNRLDFGALGLPTGEQAEMPSDWFAAMDTNQDGFLSKLEFLGEIDDFSALDADKDGFIARKEVY